MIERYTLPEMGNIWSDFTKYQKWLDVEVLAVEAWCELGEVPPQAVAVIREKAAFTPGRILEIEAVTHHDVIAFLTNVAENVGEDSRYIHYGLTSSDVLDTGLALQMRDAMDIILAEAEALARTLRARALEFRDTAMIGRTHGIHAEPTTFGTSWRSIPSRWCATSNGCAGPARSSATASSRERWAPTETSTRGWKLTSARSSACGRPRSPPRCCSGTATPST